MRVKDASFKRVRYEYQPNVLFSYMAMGVQCTLEALVVQSTQNYNVPKHF